MFDRFTERARRAVVFAQDEARSLGHQHMGTEHELLGLLREGEGIAARVLTELGVTLDAARAEVRALLGEGPRETTGQIPFTQRAKRVLELAADEANDLGHRYVGTEHILLGVLRLGKGRGCDGWIGSARRPRACASERSPC